MHASEECVAPGRAALLSVVRHEDGTFSADAVDVRRFANREAAMIDARLHPADVVAHDEQDVGLLLRGGGAGAQSQACDQRDQGGDGFSNMSHVLPPYLMVG